MFQKVSTLLFTLKIDAHNGHILESPSVFNETFTVFFAQFGQNTPVTQIK